MRYFFIGTCTKFDCIFFITDEKRCVDGVLAKNERIWVIKFILLMD